LIDDFFGPLTQQPRDVRHPRMKSRPLAQLTYRDNSAPKHHLDQLPTLACDAQNVDLDSTTPAGHAFHPAVRAEDAQKKWQ
jgi:hypothetical protein